jgi:succinyl-CoA synthetase beta subunit
MRLAEIDGKALLRRYGIAVPRGVLLEAGDSAPAEAKDWPGHVLKAQVLEGGRGKRGLVRRLADLAQLAPSRQGITDALGDSAAPFLLEEAVAIAREIYLACDTKIIRDDSAAFRHDPEEFPVSRALAERAMTPLERSARELGFQLVEIDGDVALVTAGAGLGMMMMDLLADHGLTAACFMDNLRGAPDETMAERLRIARVIAQRPQVRAIVFQTVLASRSLADRMDALLAWVAAEPLPKPLFVGIAAGHAAARKMSAEAAVAKLGAAGIAAFTDPVALVRAVADAVGGKAPS